MWALINKEFVQLRSYLLQIAGAIILIALFFGDSLEGFLVSYLNIFPVIMAMTLPQVLFGLEDRGNTLVFLRSLPVRPRQIVAGKFLVSVIVIGALVFVALGFAALQGQMEAALGRSSVVLVLAAFLLGLSLYLHFRLGTGAARIALLIVLMVLAFLGMGNAVSAIMSFVPLQRIGVWFGSLPGMAGAAALAALIVWIFFVASARVFTRQDVSRMP